MATSKLKLYDTNCKEQGGGGRNGLKFATLNDKS